MDAVALALALGFVIGAFSATRASVVGLAVIAIIAFVIAALAASETYGLLTSVGVGALTAIAIQAGYVAALAAFVAYRNRSDWSRESPKRPDAGIGAAANPRRGNRD